MWQAVQWCGHYCILSFVFIKRCGKGENGCADNVIESN